MQAKQWFKGFFLGQFMSFSGRIWLFIMKEHEMSLKNRPLVVGNWKMNGSRASLAELAAMGKGFDGALRSKIDLVLCPPMTLVALAAQAAVGTGIAIGAQNCHAKVSGAHTGDVSAEMLADIGASAVMVGHSERRTDYKEKDADVRAKAEAARRAGLMAVMCLGETKAEREAGKALSVVRRQLKESIPEGMPAHQLVIGYEPVWAIGTGLVPTAKDVEEVHALIRGDLKRLLGKDEGAKVRILYGGSVKPSNAAELLAVANVDGLLVGGASLKAEDFLTIAGYYR
jgi:triosephosphate isomerase